MNFRLRTLLIAGVTLVVAWFIATGGYIWAKQSKMTAEKVEHYIASTEFGTLSGDERAKAIEELANRINALSPDERREMRLRRAWESWFLQMTEDEKMRFVEATMPTGIKQMMTAFEELPAEKRKRTIDEAMKRLREANELPVQDNPFRRMSETHTNPPPPISPELEERMRIIGIRTFYAESSAQTKAEVAPLLEEIQRMMNTGARLR